MPSSLGPAEILVVLIVALIVLGPKRLPEAGRQVGKALSEIRRWSQDVKYEMNQAFNAEVVTRDPTPLAEPPPAAAVPVEPVPAAASPAEAAVGESGQSGESAESGGAGDAGESPAPAPEARADEPRS